jgi:hypothetical protein
MPEGAGKPAPGGGILTLERVPQREFHHARVGESGAEIAKAAAARQQLVPVKLHRAHVKPRGISDIEDFPGELQCLSFGNSPALAYTCINVEGTRPTQLIALPGFARKCLAELVDGCVRVTRVGDARITEHVGSWISALLGNCESACLRTLAVEYRLRFQFKVCSPTKTAAN